MSGENGDGKVLRPVFGKGRTPLPVEDQKLVQQPQESALSIQDDESFFKLNTERSFNALKLLVQFDSFIRSLRGFVQKDSNVALRRQGLRATSLESLVGMIEQSSDQQWKQHPSYYRAAFEELGERLKRLRPAIPDSYKQKLKGRILNASDAVKEDYLFMLLQQEKVLQSTKDLGPKATDYIFDELPNFIYDRADLELRRQGLKEHRLEDLCAIMNKSTKKDWGGYPHFYGAVILEIDDRIKSVSASE